MSHTLECKIVLDHVCVHIYYTRAKIKKESDVGMLLTTKQ